MTAETTDLAQRLVEAAAWQMRLAEEGADTEAEFELWRSDPENARAWQRLETPWNLIGEHANDPKMVAYRQAALSDARTTNASLNRHRAHWPWHRAVAAAVVFVVAGVSGYWWWTSPADYSTSFGERRIVALADGSKISLDSDSEVTVRYTRNTRELHLLKGQARFDVAHDVERPFSVLARDQKVIATGTAFNVDMTQPKVLVTLIEGHVVVIDESAPVPTPTSLTPPARKRTVELKAGEQLAALPDKKPQIMPADVQSVVAWTGGQLIFDNEPLSEVVARVNHYATTPIVIADKDAGALRLSGSFNTGDTQGFLDIVTRYLPVKEEIDADGRVMLRKK